MHLVVHVWREAVKAHVLPADDTFLGVLLALVPEQVQEAETSTRDVELQANRAFSIFRLTLSES